MTHHRHDLSALARQLQSQVDGANTQGRLADSQKEAESLEMYRKAVCALECKTGLWEWELSGLMTDIGDWLLEQKASGYGY